MNGYSKIIKVVGIDQNPSRSSLDSSDLNIINDTMPPPQTPNPKVDKNQETIFTGQMVVNKKNSSSRPNTNSAQDSSSDKEDDEQEAVGNYSVNGGEMLGPKLRRNSSVSSAYALQAAVKRAFSMRRSSSVSERYCRIHDQSVTLASSSPPPPFDDDEHWVTNGARVRSVNKKKNGRGKILKAWKKLFGL